MESDDCRVSNVESLDELFDPTVELPAALLLALTGCGGGTACCRCIGGQRRLVGYCC